MAPVIINPVKTAHVTTNDRWLTMNLRSELRQSDQQDDEVKCPHLSLPRIRQVQVVGLRSNQVTKLVRSLPMPTALDAVIAMQILCVARPVSRLQMRR
jgi:hypothetical protein